MDTPDSDFAFQRPVTDGSPMRLAGDVIDRSKEFGAVQKINRYENAGGFRPGTSSAPVLEMKPKAKDG
jgi:hypothetical protein